MDQLFSAQRALELLNAAYQWVLANVLVMHNLAQFAVAVFALVIAALIARRLGPWLEAQAGRAIVGRSAQLLAPLARPIVWLLMLWVAISAATVLEQPSALLRTMATLLVVWVAISLVSHLVTNPIWAKLIVWTAWVIAALSILDWLDPTIAILDAAAIEVGQLRISLYTVVKSTIALAVLLSLSFYFLNVFEARIRTSRALSPTVQVLMMKTLKIVLVILAILIAIRSVGIDLTALAVVGGVIGIGLGFGFQKAVSNLISGVILLIDKSIKPGDVISVSGTYGWVTTLGGRYVAVVTRDGVEHLIPNDTLISERVENWTHTHNRTRLKVDVGVHHSTDLVRAIALCEEAARETERVLEDPEPKCLFIEFGESALKLQLRFWIADAPNGVQNVKSAVLLKIWHKFRENQIRVPYSQHDVHIRSAPAQIAQGSLPGV